MKLPKVEKIHFIGIGGYGMSALAQVMLILGHKVSGSDLKESPLTVRLAAQGAEIKLGHSRDNLGNCGLVVFSTAIPADNVEMREAADRNLPLWHRSELLAGLINERYGIAVAGTHGKTTTTSMLALLLAEGGLDPTAVVGGTVAAFNGNARVGKSRYLVAEACESDRSFLRYYPHIALVTNMEPDHLEHYNGDFNLLRAAYLDFLNHLHPEGFAVLCADDPNLRELIPLIDRKVVTYGLEGTGRTGADFRGCRVTIADRSSTFVLCRHEEPITGEVALKVPGRHNVSNAVGALAVAALLGLDPDRCAGVLAEFYGAGRRFELVGEAGGITVIDDYAHHPTEVKVTLEAAKASGRRIIAVFQPHRYTRTAYFFEDFARAFTGADLVLLHRVYPAGEQPIEGITAAALAERIRQVKGDPVYAEDDMEKLENLALEYARPGDLVLVMGAGDISRLSYSLFKRLQEDTEAKQV